MRALMAAFELVDDRAADYSDIHFFSLVADNAWNAGVVWVRRSPNGGAWTWEQRAAR